MRLAILPAILTPAFLIVVAVVIGFVILALFMPFVQILQVLK